MTMNNIMDPRKDMLDYEYDSRMIGQYEICL